MRRILAALVLASSAAVAAPSLADAACNHPYYPAKEGSVWVYRDHDGNTSEMKVASVDGSTFTMDVTVTPDESAARADEGKKKKKKKKSEPAGPTTMTMKGWCSADGVRMNMGGATFRGAEGFEMKTISEEGQVLPAAAKLKEGATWTHAAKQSMTAEGAPMQMTMETTTDYKVVGTEKVTVPAGEFTAIRIEGDGKSTMNMEGPMAAMMPKQPPQTTKSTFWVVKGVGIVKSEVTPAAAGKKKKGQPEPYASELVKHTP